MALIVDSEDTATPRRVDPMSEMVGSGVFVRRHRFANLYIRFEWGHTPRLLVSRYYWDAVPPVAIDFMKELKFGHVEVEAKQVYFAKIGITYAVCDGQYDLETLQQQLLTAEPEPKSKKENGQTEAPIMAAPRRRR